jgi:hypothetical protein
VNEQTTVLPEIRLKWIRGNEKIDFSRPNTTLCVGQRGTGKSSLLEALGTRYPKIIDLFGSKDNEGLAWCKPESPFHNILFVIGRNVEVASQWDKIAIDKLTLADFKNYEVITTCYAFFNTVHEYFSALQRITGILWEKRTSWTEPWNVIIREAANWLYSRIQIVKDSEMAKADFIQTLREARHSGLAVSVDTVRWTDIDKAVRDISDFLFLKRVGAIGLPKDLRYVYRYITPDSMMRMQPSIFALLTSQGSIGYGNFDYPRWHKEERENILFKLNIDVQHLGDMERDLGYTVGLIEHAKIIESYMENSSMSKTAALANRSKATVWSEVKIHNDSIAEVGRCLECQKANGKYMNQPIKKRKKLKDF